MKIPPLAAHTAALLLAVSLLAACGQTTDTRVAPVEIGKDTSCSLDGMLLGDYPGPKAITAAAAQYHFVTSLFLSFAGISASIATSPKGIFNSAMR